MSIIPKLKKKPPLHSSATGPAQHKACATVDELEKIANVLSSQADVLKEKLIDVTSTATEVDSRSGADRAVSRNPTPDLKNLGKDPSTERITRSMPVAVPTSKLKAESLSTNSSKPSNTTGSISPTHSLGLEPSSTSGPSEPISSRSHNIAEVTDSTVSTKSSESERDVIDLCISTDESTLEQEEPPAFDEEDDGVYKSDICLPKLLESNVLPTPEPTNLAFVGQSWEGKEDITVPEPPLPYPEEDPKSSSDYAKTPPIQPFDTTSMTPPIPRESCISSVASDEWDNSLHLPASPSKNEAISPPLKNSSFTAFEPEPAAEKSSNVLPNPPVADEGAGSPSTLDPNLHILPSKSHPAPSKKPPDERKDSETEIRILQTRSKDPNVPSKAKRKRNKVPNLAEERPGKSKRTRVSQNSQQYDIRFIVVECVKKCIQEVNSKLERSRFKVLCKTVSKRLLGSWSARRSPRQRSIEKWLKHRHVKIVRLVEKYLEKNII